jgi:hypothetical protein
VGLQLMGPPESLHARFAQPGFAGHRAHAPGPAVRTPVRARLKARPTAFAGSRGFASPSRDVLSAPWDTTLSATG